MMRKVFVLACVAGLLVACDDDPGTTSMGTPDGDGDGDNGDAADGDTDSDDDTSDSNDEEDEDGAQGDGGGDGDAGKACATVLQATIRDFKFDHPDFETNGFRSDVGLKNLVLADLGDDKKPVYASAGATAQTTGPTEFAQWYNDVEGVNHAIQIEIPLTGDGTGRYVYDNQFFFPIDGMSIFPDEGMDNSMPSQLRNFAFTTEIHTEFEYKGNEVFTFVGDDDLWLFINGKLAIDLGGLHPKLPGMVDLAARAAELGITPGNKYSMDIFHAERHTDASTFRIETTIDCLIPVIL
jgi:fibro-slime domain-containing protein